MTDTSELCGAKTSRGYNQTTASGRAFYATDPRPEDVFIDDIAAHLSRICRFGGALKERIDFPYETLSPAEYGRLWGTRQIYEHESGEGVCLDVEIYSVAQHSVLVADNVPEPFRLRALLHDAAEAYIGDMIKPIKMVMTLHPSLWEEVCDKLRVSPASGEWDAAQTMAVLPCFKRLEAGVAKAIYARFGLPEFDEEADAAIAIADYRAVLTEHRDLQVNTGAVDWGKPTEKPFPERVIPLLPSAARALFLQRFNELYKGE